MPTRKRKKAPPPSRTQRKTRERGWSVMNGQCSRRAVAGRELPIAGALRSRLKVQSSQLVKDGREECPDFAEEAVRLFGLRRLVLRGLGLGGFLLAAGRRQHRRLEVYDLGVLQLQHYDIRPQVRSGIVAVVDERSVDGEMLFGRRRGRQLLAGLRLRRSRQHRGCWRGAGLVGGAA